MKFKWEVILLIISVIYTSVIYYNRVNIIKWYVEKISSAHAEEKFRFRFRLESMLTFILLAIMMTFFLLALSIVIIDILGIIRMIHANINQTTFPRPYARLRSPITTAAAPAA